MIRPATPAHARSLAALARIPLDEFRRRVWAHWMMVDKARLGWGIPEGGYPRFDREQLRPVLDRGFIRATFHRPDGDDSSLTGEPMNRDARVEALKRKERYILGYAAMLDDAWHREQEFVALSYHGSAWDPDFGELLSAGRFAEWIDRQRRSLMHVVNLKCCDIGLDHEATMRPGYEAESGGAVRGFPPGAWEASWAWTQVLIALKRLQGRRVWIEALPHRDAPHQHACHCMHVERVHDRAASRDVYPFLRTRPSDCQVYADEALGHTGSEWATPVQQLGGDILLTDNTIGAGHSLDSFAESIARVLCRGPRFHWAGALAYLPATVERLHQAVVRVAAQAGDTTLARDEDTSAAAGGTDR